MTKKSLLLVDAHVHIHSCFDTDRFLSAAYENFRRQQLIQNAVEFTGVLLLTESAWDNGFQQLLSECSADRSNNNQVWRFSTTKETNSIKAEHQNGSAIFIIAGRQIVTQERLEVLALGTGSTFVDGKPIHAVIAEVKADGALAVIPWGFGKWLGPRGEILKKLLEGDVGEGFFLGDNGGRITLLPYPEHFNQAKLKKIKILPGSDPLPFASEIARLGSFGFSFRGNINENQPTEGIKRLLLDKKTETLAYGKLENPLRFLRNQIRIRFV